MEFSERKRTVERLLRMKYPFSWAPPPISPLRGSSGGKVGEDDRAAFANAMKLIEVERGRLMALSSNELEAAFDTAKHAEEAKAFLKEEIAEKGRFFSHAPAVADFDYWAKVEYWSLDESVALLLGKAPEVVNWKSIESYVNISAFAKQYERLRKLALRSQTMNRGQTAVYPSAVLAWAAEMDIPVPQELREALVGREARKLAAATSRAEAQRQSELLVADDLPEASMPQPAKPASLASVKAAEKMAHAITTDGAPRATWMLGLEALLPSFERELGRPASVREVIKHLKENGSSYRIESDGGPDQLTWKTRMGDKKVVATKTISNAISDWRKGRGPA